MSKSNNPEAFFEERPIMGENPFEALEDERKNAFDGKPTSGQVVEIGNREYLIQSQGTESGSNIFVYGEVVSDDTLEAQGAVLKEPEVPQNYVAHALDLEVQEVSVDYAEYNPNNDNFFEHSGDIYFKLGDEV